MNAVICCDTREPWPHPWRTYLPAEVRLERATLETGDFCLAGLDEGAVVERKTTADFLACVGRERARFDRELMRARYCQSFCILVEGSLTDVLNAARDLHPNAILGSLAAWTRRGWPVVFAGDVQNAVEFAVRYLTGPVNEAKRLVTAYGKTCAM